MKAIALIDGEHHADVVRDALAELPFDFVGAILCGGTEKLRGGEEYGLPMRYEAPETFQAAAALLRGSAAARPLAGGTDLLVQLRTGLVEPELIVDLKKLPGLRTIA